jgi:uncharacterized protein (DUF885 family)
VRAHLIHRHIHRAVERDEGEVGQVNLVFLVEDLLALVRICRYIAGIEMHTKGMTMEQAVELFVNEAYMERVGAEREARRGTADPTYLVYTLGKHEILKLRDEYRARTGATLAGFHDALLRTGYPPLPIARQILFGER